MGTEAGAGGAGSRSQSRGVEAHTGLEAHPAWLHSRGLPPVPGSPPPDTQAGPMYPSPGSLKPGSWPDTEWLVGAGVSKQAQGQESRESRDPGV